MEREAIFAYVRKKYGTQPEHPWKQYPGYAVLRHRNGKWYSVIMNLKSSQLGLDGDDDVEVMNVKCDPELTGVIIQSHGFHPGYHMNKKYWISILLDGSVEDAKILDFLDSSYHFIDRKSNRKSSLI